MKYNKINLHSDRVDQLIFLGKSVPRIGLYEQAVMVHFCYRFHKMEEKSPMLICALCDPPHNCQGTLVRDPAPASVTALKATVKERVDLGEAKLLPYHNYLQKEDPSKIR